MGIFSGNTTSIGKYNEMEIPFIEGYSNSEVAFLNIISETVRNEAEIFDESIISDFNELALTFKKEELEQMGMVAEAASIEVVTESAKDIWEKIKKMVMVVASKVKSAYEAVKIRITAFLTKDYYKFYSKHVDRFTNYAKNTKGKYSFRMPDTPLSAFNLTLDKTINNTMKKDETAIEKDMEKIQNGDFKLALFNQFVTCHSEKEFKENFTKLYFKDKVDYDHVTNDMIKEIKRILGGKDMVKAIETAQSQNNELFKNLLKDIDDCKSFISNSDSDNNVINVGDKNYSSTNKDLTNKRLNLLFKRLSIIQTVDNTVNSIYIGLVKMHIAQCKAVFNKVVARSQFTEQTLLDAIEEVAMTETMEYLNM